MHFGVDARNQFDLNVIAPAILCSTLFHMLWKNVSVEQQNVSILNVTSLSGSNVFGGTGQGLYAATKAAANMLTMHMAEDYGLYGIKVNALVPNAFPSIVQTSVVASYALKILTMDVSRRLFALDEKHKLAVA